MATSPTELSVEVVGPLAEITLRRRFRNDDTLPVDTELWFGLPAGGILDQFVVTVGSRTIRSRVVASEQAVAEYVQAANQGRVASLVEQQEPDLVVQRIANILPGEDIEVELHLVAQVARRAGTWELALPLTVAPRLQDPAGKGPTYTLPGEQPADALRDRVEARIHVQAGKPIRWMESPTHAHRTRLSSTEGSLWVEGARADRDLVVRWSTAVPEAGTSFLVSGDHGLLMIEPPAPWARIEPPPADVVLLVDVSDTMLGPRWARTLLAVEALMAELRDQDTLTLLVFADTVRGLAVREPATIDNLSEILRALEHIPMGGRTNLPLALRFALSLPSPPGRNRTVVLLSDGGAEPVDPSLLTPGTTVHTVGIGEAVNRGLLQSLATWGQGVAAFLSSGDPIEEAMAGVLDGLRGPVLTDATATFSGQESDPQPLPDLYADQLVSLPVRGVSCRQSVRIEGLFAGRPYKQEVAATCTEQSRQIEVLWAQRQVTLLGATDPQAATEIAVKYAILSPFTSLVGTDTEVHNPQGWAASTSVGVAAAADLGPIIDTESTSSGLVITKQFLQRIPAGRTYQSAVQTVAGVIGAAGGNPNMGGASTNENTFILDGANVTDPVSGTFSLNFNFDAIYPLDGILSAYLPEHPGRSGHAARLEMASGDNNLSAAAAITHEAGTSSERPLQADRLTAQLSGPLLRDHLWISGSYGFGRSGLPLSPYVGNSDQGHRDYQGHLGALKLTAQPNPGHRFTLSGTGDTALLALGQGEAPEQRRMSGLSTARWQWFFSPGGSLDTLGAVQRLEVGSDERGSEQVQTRIGASDLYDMWGGTHDLKAGVEVVRTSWRPGGAWGEIWLGLPLTEPGSALRTGWFLQDSYEPWSYLTLNAGVRVEHTLGRTQVGPRLHVAWDPFQDQKSELAAGFGRVYGHLGLATAVIDPEQGLSRLDEGMVLARREVIRHLSLGLQAWLRARSGLPLVGGGREERRAWSTLLFLHKMTAHRWGGELSWRHSRLLSPSPAVLVDDGLEGFTHEISGSLHWDLPTDPFTHSLAISGSWYSDPLGTIVPDPLSGSLPNLPRWSLGLRASQRFDTRKGGFFLDLEGSYVELLEDGRDLSRWIRPDLPLLELPAWSGPRLTATLRYGF